MRITVLDGKTSETDLSCEIEKDLKKFCNPYQTTWIGLKEKNIKPCTGCFGCWVKTPGLCVIADDDATEIVRAMVNSDLIVELSPVTFGGYSSELKKILDRSIPVLLPYFKRVKGEIHHHQRYLRIPNQLTVGYMDYADPLTVQCFQKLVLRNVLNMQPPKWSSAVLDNLHDVRTKLEKAFDEVMP